MRQSMFSSCSRDSVGLGLSPSPAWHLEQPCAITLPSLLTALPIQLASGLVQKSFIVLSLPRRRPAALTSPGVSPCHW